MYQIRDTAPQPHHTDAGLQAVEMEPVRTVGTEAGLGGRQQAAPGPALPAAPVCWGERPRPEASSSSPAPPVLQLEAGPAGETQLRSCFRRRRQRQGQSHPRPPGTSERRVEISRYEISRYSRYDRSILSRYNRKVYKEMSGNLFVRQKTNKDIY